MKNLLWNMRNLRDIWPMLMLVATTMLVWHFFAWWVALIALVLGYWYLGKLTYVEAITAIQQLTGLDYYRANKIYKAGLTGDWSEIKTSELQVHGFDPRGPQRKLKEQLSALIIAERTRRDVIQEW
jgi:hypothetical protein